MPTPNTADAMKRHKAGKAGFTDKAHLKAKGLIPRADGTKRKSPKYEALDKDDVSTIKPIIKQLKKSVTKHATQAKQLQKDISDDLDAQPQDKDVKKVSSLLGKSPKDVAGFVNKYDGLDADDLLDVLDTARAEPHHIRRYSLMVMAAIKGNRRALKGLDQLFGFL